MAATPEREEMLAAGVRAALQSTLLVSRSGQILGVFSTHYREPRRPGERELRLLDLLARQAADLIERKRAETELLASEGRSPAACRRHAANGLDRPPRWKARRYYNQRWHDFTGSRPDQFGDWSWEPVLHPGRREALL